MEKIPIEISARHVHLTRETFLKLFGSAAELAAEKKLSQADEFASPHTVTLQCGDRKIHRVRVLGPWRKHDQVEVTATDGHTLRARVPLRLSGDVKGSAPVTLLGPVGKIDLPEGMIIARRHLHLGPADAQRLGVRDGQEVALEVAGARAGRLGQCVVRVKPGYNLSFHIDTDEGNALGLSGQAQGNLIIL